MKDTVDFANKYNYNLIWVLSNLDTILSNRKVFCDHSFDRTHTCRNISIVLLFQKIIRLLYYAHAYNLDSFKFNIDMAYYEKRLLPILNTGSTEFYNSNQDWQRIDKLNFISKYKLCYDNLQVCLVKSKNCGICTKCKKTLMGLDALGENILRLFQNSFDIYTYIEQYRENWFNNIFLRKKKQL